MRQSPKLMKPDQTTADLSSGRPDDTGPPAWWVALQLGALSFHIPLSVLTGSQRSLASESEALLTGALVFALSLVAHALLRRAVGSWASLEMTSAALLFFWHWGAFGSTGELLGVPVLTLLVAAAVIAAARRFSSSLLLRKGAFVASVTLSGTMLVLLAVSIASTPDPVVAATEQPELGTATAKPDVVFVVVDSYARGDVLLDLYGYDNSAFISGLEAQGFTVPSHARANYTGTHSSVPSVLDLAYPIKDGTSLGAADLDRLAEMMGGDNNTVRYLKSSGYTYVHGDTQTWINRCTDEVDICLPGPPIKATVFRLLADTPLGPFLYPRTGEPETNLNLKRIDQLRSWRSIRSEWGSAPVFAFLHLELPHPPFYLDADCDVDVREGFGGPTMTWEVTSEEHLELRKDAYIEQLRCANAVIEDFLTQLSGEEIVIITADHGPDSEGTLGADVSSWTETQLWERLATMTALRLPASCDSEVPEDLDLVNLLRIALSCIQPNQLSLLPGSYHAATYEGPVIPLKDPDESADLETGRNSEG